MGWPIVKSNSHITTPVALSDFVPLGIVEQQKPDGSLALMDDPKWKSSNRIPFLWGFTADKAHSIILHGGVNVTFCRFMVSIDGQAWQTIPLNLPTYYKPDGAYGIPYPTVHSNPNAQYVAAIAYDEITRTWFVKIIRTRDGLTVIDVVGKAAGSPFWMGKPEGPYLIQGLGTEVKELDTWGGYADYANIELKYTDPGTGLQATFTGKMIMDREYHRSYIDNQPVTGHSFTAFSIHSPLIDAAFLHSVDPRTGGTTIPEVQLPCEKQARLNIIPTGQSYQWDDFTYTDTSNKQLIPDGMKISGVSPDLGDINLEATIQQSFGWTPTVGTWFNPVALHTWGRHFLRWNGTIGGHIVENAIGFGEFTRVYQPSIDDLPKIASALGLVILDASLIGYYIATHISLEDVKRVLRL